MARVLVVDDNQDTCELLARILRRAGHEAACETSAPRALRYLAAQVPDLVILDVMMPGMTGLELLQKLRADLAEHASIRVVVFSALSDAKTRAEAQRLGADDYVVKGTGWVDLQAAIEKHIGPTRLSRAEPDAAGQTQ